MLLKVKIALITCKKNYNWNKFQLYIALANYEITGWYVIFTNVIYKKCSQSLCFKGKSLWYKKAETDMEQTFRIASTLIWVH